MLRYEKRLLKLYCFWIIALSPVILICWHKEYLDLSFYSLYLFIRNFFLAYEFGASWFFGALIVGVPIVYLLTRVFKDWLVWIIPMAIYVYLFMECDNKTLYLWYEENIRTPILSFPAGLIWITIGYLFSNEKFEQLRINTPVWICALLLMASIVLGTIFEEYDYLFRIVSVVSVVIPAFNLKMGHTEICKRLRIYSIHFFCLHYSFLAGLGGVLRKLDMEYLTGNKILLYLFTLFVCWCISEAIIHLKDMKGLKWLRYSM